MKKDYFKKNYSGTAVNEISKYLDDLKKDDIKLLDVIKESNKSEQILLTGSLMENYINALNKAFNDKIALLSANEAEDLYRHINYKLRKKENENNQAKNSLKELEKKEQDLFDKISKDKKITIVATAITFITSGVSLTTIVALLTMLTSPYIYASILIASLISSYLAYKLNAKSPTFYDEEFRNILDQKSNVNKIINNNNNSLDFMYNFRKNVNEEIKDKKKNTFNNQNNEFDIEKVKAFYKKKK